MWPFKSKQSESIRLQVVDVPDPTDTTPDRLRYLQEVYRTGKYPPMIWKLAGTADNMVLGQDGIRPMFGDNEAGLAAIAAWKAFRVDQAGMLRIRDFQRIMTVALTVEQESWTYVVGGTFTPMPPPSKVKYNDDTNLPEYYEYRRKNDVKLYRPHPGMASELSPDSLPLEQNFEPGYIWHMMVQWFPAQRRGWSVFEDMNNLLKDRQGFIGSLMRIAKLAARLALVYRRTGGNPLVDSETSERENPEIQNLDFESDSIITISPTDRIEAISSGRGPISAQDIERLVTGTVAQRAILSRMVVSGDFSETNYSSARFAHLNDIATWERYRDLILVMTQAIYDQWPDKAQYDSQMTGWHAPPFIQIDPQRSANIDKILVGMKAKSVQQVIRDMGADPESVFAEIEQFNERFPSVTPPSGGEPQPQAAHRNGHSRREVPVR